MVAFARIKPYGLGWNFNKAAKTHASSGILPPYCLPRYDLWTLENSRRYGLGDDGMAGTLATQVLEAGDLSRRVGLVCAGATRK